MFFYRLDEDIQEKLKTEAYKVREHVIKMATNGGCFLGASLSCVDIITYLYHNYLNITKENLNNPDRDYLFLSKGHDVPALYGTLAEIGFIGKDRLENHLSVNDSIYWHPNRTIPGVEYYSGSLGHLLSVAIGVAYDCKLKNGKNEIVVILGDGELNEGSVWEAFLVANAYKLNNLLVVIDRNYFQANMKTESLIPLDPIEKKIEAFGWNVHTTEGHDFTALHEAFSWATEKSSRPRAIIAETIRGKGLPSIENRADRWFCNFTSAEINDLLKELAGQEKATLKSETLIVR